MHLLTMASQGVFALQLSSAILDETMEVLERDFFWTKLSLQEARDLLSSISQPVTPHVELNVIQRDPDDNRILECNQASRSDFIVTSDKDLLDLRVYAGASIIKLGEFLSTMPYRLPER